MGMGEDVASLLEWARTQLGMSDAELLAVCREAVHDADLISTAHMTPEGFDAAVAELVQISEQTTCAIA